MAWKDCEECKGTGEIEVQTIAFDRLRVDRQGRHYHTYREYGDWHIAQCPCVGEEEYLAKEAT
jgi:hypothetical protein